MSCIAAACLDLYGKSSMCLAFISYLGLKRYIYILPYLFSSSRKSVINCSCIVFGKYLRAFLRANFFSSEFKIFFLSGALFILLSKFINSGISFGIPSKIEFLKSEFFCMCFSMKLTLQIYDICFYENYYPTNI